MPEPRSQEGLVHQALSAEARKLNDHAFVVSDRGTFWLELGRIRFDLGPTIAGARAQLAERYSWLNRSILDNKTEH